MVSQTRRPPTPRNDHEPRNRVAVLSAVIVGFLVVIVAIAAIFYGEIREFGVGLVEDDQNVAEQTDVDESGTPVVEEPLDLTYVEATVGFPQTLNPLLAESSSERSVAAMLYRSLMQADERGDPMPDLASEWTVSTDGQTHTIELDPEARWHDGEPITATDVLFTVSLVQDPEFPGDRNLSLFWKPITLTQIDDHTIEFQLMEPYVGFAHYLKLPILPRHQFGSYLAGDLADIELDTSLIGSGAFSIQEIDYSAAEIHFEQVQPAKNALNPVVFRYYDSRPEAVTAFLDGDVDGISFIPIEEIHANDNIDDAGEIIDPELSGYTALFFNVRHPHFREVNTRMAIEHGIDRDAILESVLDGGADRGSSPIPVMSSAHQPGDHAEFDPERAEELLEQEGWELQDGDEIRQRDGEYFLVPLIVNSDDSQRIAVANMIQEQLREIGISVDVQVMSNDDLQQALQNRQFTAAMYGWRTSTGSLDGFQMWHSSRGEDGSNFTGFADTLADEYLVAARQSSTIEEQNEHYEGFQQVFAEQVPAVVLFYPRYHYAVSDRIEVGEPMPLVDPGDRVRQISEWRIGGS